jgi:hypothetical protein
VTSGPTRKDRFSYHPLLLLLQRRPPPDAGHGTTTSATGDDEGKHITSKDEEEEDGLKKDEEPGDSGKPTPAAPEYTDETTTELLSELEPQQLSRRILGPCSVCSPPSSGSSSPFVYSSIRLALPLVGVFVFLR